MRQKELTIEQRKNIKDTMADWQRQCWDRNALPIIFIAMPVAGSGQDVLIYKGGNYTHEQIKKVLELLLKSMP